MRVLNVRGFYVLAMSETISFLLDATGVKILGTATALLGKSCALSTINVATTFTAELYPTVIRYVLNET